MVYFSKSALILTDDCHKNRSKSVQTEDKLVHNRWAHPKAKNGQNRRNLGDKMGARNLLNSRKKHTRLKIKAEQT